MGDPGWLSLPDPRWLSIGRPLTVMGEKYQLDEGTTGRLAERIPFPEQAARKLAIDLSVPPTLDECHGLGIDTGQAERLAQTTEMP
jgi:hypothetical protein